MATAWLSPRGWWVPPLSTRCPFGPMTRRDPKSISTGSPKWRTTWLGATSTTEDCVGLVDSSWACALAGPAVPTRISSITPQPQKRRHKYLIRFLPGPGRTEGGPLVHQPRAVHVEIGREHLVVRGEQDQPAELGDRVTDDVCRSGAEDPGDRLVGGTRGGPGQQLDRSESAAYWQFRQRPRTAKWWGLISKPNCVLAFFDRPRNSSSGASTAKPQSSQTKWQ